MMYEVLSPEFRHNDERGSLVQLVKNGYAQVNILISKAGVTRGGHYHKVSREAFYIVKGKAKILLEREEKIEECAFAEGDFFEIKPYTVHEMHFLEDCIMVVLYDQPVETAEGKDIYQQDVRRRNDAEEL